MECFDTGVSSAYSRVSPNVTEPLCRVLLRNSIGCNSSSHDSGPNGQGSSRWSAEYASILRRTVGVIFVAHQVQC